MKINILFILLVGILAISSCQLDPCANKEKFLASFDTFVEDISESEKELTLEQWKKHDVKFKKYLEDCYVNHKEDLLASEKKSFWANTIRYYYERHGNSFFAELSDETDPLAELMEKELSEVFNNPQEAIIALVKEEYGEDITQSIDKVVDEIKKLGEELKDIFKK